MKRTINHKEQKVKTPKIQINQKQLLLSINNADDSDIQKRNNDKNNELI